MTIHGFVLEASNTPCVGIGFAHLAAVLTSGQPCVGWGVWVLGETLVDVRQFAGSHELGEFGGLFVLGRYRGYRGSRRGFSCRSLRRNRWFCGSSATTGDDCSARSAHRRVPQEFAAMQLCTHGFSSLACFGKRQLTCTRIWNFRSKPVPRAD